MQKANSDSESSINLSGSGSQDHLAAPSSGSASGHNRKSESRSVIGWRPVSASSQPLQPSSTSQDEPVIVPSTPAQPIKRVLNAPYSFDCPVPAQTLQLCDKQYRSVDEFKSLTYTPVLCEPEDFTREHGYSLRQNRNGRSTELLIAITMYNESDEFMIRTLTAVFRNIRYFCELNRAYRRSAQSSEGVAKSRDSSALADGGVGVGVSQGSDSNSYVRNPDAKLPHLEAGLRGEQIWTENGWQKIVLCIISDGRFKIHHRVKKMLEVMGVMQEGLIMPEIADPMDEQGQIKNVTAHLFEYTCQSMVDTDHSIRSGTKNGIVPVQVLFCLKEKNAKKLNSHKWLFRAFAPLLNPYVCVLIDVGTRPKTADAIYHLWKAFDRDLNVAGAAGEICVMLGKNYTACSNIMHPMIASQNFEYKMSNILDKTLESCFGYISVLPGAFSAYRWEALQDTNSESGPLISYFKGEKPKPKGNVFASNMYLAEDRILCFELIAKTDSKWLLHYVKDATAETDVPTSVAEFISQRRRWLNGTFFCQVFAIFNFNRIWTTRHSYVRKVALTVQLVYSAVTLVFSWFGLANFYLSFYLLTAQTFVNPSNFSAQMQELMFYILRVVYLFIILAQFICALGNRPQGAEAIFVGSMSVFGLLMLYMVVVTIFLIVQTFAELNANGENFLTAGGTSRDLLIAGSSTYGVYFLSSFLYGEFTHIFTCIAQYLLLLPSYVNTLAIYAFCNSHDVRYPFKF
eukprot:Partr_v1_DN28088_c0_g1_i2_m57371 putative monooxygenase